MKMQTYGKRRIIIVMVVSMTLMSGIFSDNVFGMGSMCNPCQHIDWDYCAGDWACFGCPGRCGSCYSCVSQNCVSNCNSQQCQECNVVPDNSCYGSHCEGCSASKCDSSQCQQCDGAGHCIVCGSDPGLACCNGQCYDRETECCMNGNIVPKCGEQCYDPETQQCCTSLFGGVKTVCDKSLKCCPTGICCEQNDKCCDNFSCAKPCELEENTAMCTGETLGCPDCFTNCEENYKYVYTGNSTYTCKEQGCPGDCENDEPVVCYKKIPCQTNLIPKANCILGTCFLVQPGNCTPMCVCNQCIPTNENIQEFTMPSKKCKQ